jgi:hypothetical protein
MQHRHIEFQPSTWRARIGIVLASTLALGLAVAFIVLSLGLFIVLLPVVAVFLGIAWWRFRKFAAAVREQAANNPDGGGEQTIEIDYRVVGDPEGTRRK